MNRNRVEQIIDYVKGSPINMDYGRWGALNQKQRQCIKDLCKSWLVLDEATNIQAKEIERLNNIINKTIEYLEYQISQLDFYEDTKAKMLGSMTIVLLKGSDKK